jgi:triosephosphate isomerase
VKSRGVLIAGNWKMNHGLVETREFFRLLRETGPSLDAIEKLRSARLRAWAFPPMTSLQVAEAEIQNLVFPFRIGARALTGHSERRQYFGETNETVRKRTESLLKQDFQVILCVGETKAEREAGKTFAIVEEQLRVALGIVETSVSPIAEYLDGRLIIAYEPVWAIGTGLTATPAQAEEAHAMIRDFLTKRLGPAVAAKTPVLYGGSVTPENADALLACENIDGALVGLCLKLGREH